MTRTEIENKMKEIIAVQFGIRIDEVELDLNFVKDLNADSLDAVEMVMMTEDHFDIRIEDEEADRFFTVGGVVDFVEKKINDKSSKY